uniref:ZP domain-containing protein n=1 Tax=Ascaris lumbricoides TaxID=6252 RepID=A0A9J2QBY8_ASCLU
AVHKVGEHLYKLTHNCIRQPTTVRVSCHKVHSLTMIALFLLAAASFLTSGNPCKETLEEAHKSCFDAGAISASEGTFLYRIENAESASCGLEGAFDVSFRKAESTLTCDRPGSTVRH